MFFTMTDLWLLVAALLMVVFSLQLRFRPQEAPDVAMQQAMGEVCRWAAVLALAYFAGNVAIRLVNAWYAAGGAPPLEWKGLLWIASVVVALGVAYPLGVVLTFTSRKQQPRP